MHRDTRRKVANEWQYAREWGEGGAQREHWSALARADAYSGLDYSGSDVASEHWREIVRWSKATRFTTLNLDAAQAAPLPWIPTQQG